MTSQLIIISDVTIRQDKDGKFNINDLHKAAGGEKRHSPNYWLANQQTKELIDVMSQQNTGIPVVSVSGRNGGTFVEKELVYSYAMWISPEFNLRVIRTFDAIANGKIQEAQAIATDKIQNVEKVLETTIHFAEMFGLEGNQKLLSANQATYSLTGVNVMELMQIPALVAPVQEVVLTPTELGRELNLSPQAMNSTLEAMGLQVARRDIKGNKYWELTEHGKRYGAYHDTQKRHSNGTPVQQIKWYRSVLEYLAKAA